MRKIGLEIFIKILWFCTMAGGMASIIAIATVQEFGGIGFATVAGAFLGAIMKSLLDWAIRKIRE